MASSGHQIHIPKTARRYPHVSLDPEKVFAQSVEKLQQCLDACSRMRTFSEMKTSLEEISELVKFFFSDTNELAQLYMDGSVS